MKNNISIQKNSSSHPHRMVLTRTVAFLLVFVMALASVPNFGTQENYENGAVETVYAAESGISWDSWEDLYNSMLESGYGASYLKDSVSIGDDFWDRLVDVMDSLGLEEDDSDYEKFVAIALWIGSNVTYDYSLEGDNIHNAYGALVNGSCVCDGYAYLICIMCGYVGIDAMRISNGNHSWNVVKINSSWYWVDLTQFDGTTEQSAALQLSGNDCWWVMRYGFDHNSTYHFGLDPEIGDLISEHGYLYDNSSCNGQHTWEIDGWLDSGLNGECSFGYIHYECTECGCGYYEKIESGTAHSYEEVITEPTCTSQGYTTYVCSVCGEYYVEDYYTYKFNYTDALGHEDDGVVETVREATCTEDGLGWTHCTRCGTIVESVSLPATGHSWDNGTVTTETTASTAGTITYTCTTCGETKTETIAATGGSLEDAVITLEYDSCTYDGTIHMPEVTVTFNNQVVENTSTTTTTTSTTAVVEGDMYTVTYRTGASYKAAGTVPVVISAGTNGLFTGEVTLYFTIEKADTTVTASVDSSTIKAGETAQITASAAVDTTGTARTCYYESSDTSVATVSSTGLVTGVSSGTATITVYTAENKSYYNQGYTYITITVGEADKIDLSSANIIFESTKFTYDGTSQEPSLIVMLNTTELTEGTDYTLTYSNNTNAGTASVIATGCGNYTGTVTKTFTIAAADISTYTVTLSVSSFTYDGKAKTPTVTLSASNGSTIASSCYTVTYSGNVNAGTAKATITGKGNYTGTVTKTFTINKASQTVTISGATQYTMGESLSLTATTSGNGAITWTYANGLLSALAGTGRAGTYTVTATAAETTNYKAGSASVSVTVIEAEPESDSEPEEETESESASTETESESEIESESESEPESDSQAESESESEGEVESESEPGSESEFESESEPESESEEASESESESESETVSESEQESESEAASISISAAKVKLSTTSYTYTGSAKKPTVTVTLNGVTLKKGTDYTVTYSNNTNAGTAYVTVKGTGSYTGTVKASFTIAKATQTISVKTKGSSSIKAGKATTWTAKTSGNGKITYSTTASSSVGTVNSSTGKVTANGVGTIKVYAQAAATTNYRASSKKLIATIKVGLTAPSVSSVVQQNTAVTVKWAQVKGAKGYYIYRSTSKSSGYKLVKKITSGKTVSYKDTSSKTNGKTYYYRVYAYSGSTKSSASAVKSIKYMKGTVSSLTNTSSGIMVKWSKVSGATGYYIYRKASTESRYTLVKTITSGSKVSYLDTKVKSKNGTTYTYYVSPFNSKSKGAYSLKKTVRLTSATLSSAKNTSSKKITVKWAKNSKASGYQIQYSTSKTFASGSKTKTLTVSGSATVSRTIGNLTKGKTYYVRVRSYKTVSEKKYYSAWSSKKSVKVSK